jgi:hypothetical protein
VGQECWLRVRQRFAKLAFMASKLELGALAGGEQAALAEPSSAFLA